MNSQRSMPVLSFKEQIILRLVLVSIFLLAVPGCFADPLSVIAEEREAYKQLEKES